MPKTKTIRVTAEDIREGVEGDAHDCPIAHAAKRAFGVERDVTCGDDVLEVEGHEFPLPERACVFVADFDRGKPVAPFAFRVTL